MTLKLLKLLVLFAACGIAHAQTDCDKYCRGKQVQDRTAAAARSVVRGQKHAASRSRGHPAGASRLHDSSSGEPYCDCSSSNRRSAAGGISSRQGGSDLQSFPQQVFESFLEQPGVSEFPNIFNAAFGASGGGSGTPGSGSSGGLGSSGDSGSSGGSGSFGGGSGIMSAAGLPMQFMNSFLGGGGRGGETGSQGNPLSTFENLLEGSSSGSGTPGGGFGIFPFPGVAQQFIENAMGGGGSQGSSSSPGRQSGQNEISRCEDICNFRVPNSERQGAAHGRGGRLGGRSQRAAAHNARQADRCPDSCRQLLQYLVSSTGNSGNSGELETSDNGLDGSYTGSVSSSGSSGDSPEGQDDSVTE